MELKEWPPPYGPRAFVWLDHADQIASSLGIVETAVVTGLLVCSQRSTHSEQVKGS